MGRWEIESAWGPGDDDPAPRRHGPSRRVPSRWLALAIGVIVVAAAAVVLARSGANSADTTSSSTTTVARTTVATTAEGPTSTDAVNLPPVTALPADSRVVAVIGNKVVARGAGTNDLLGVVDVTSDASAPRRRVVDALGSTVLVQGRSQEGATGTWALPSDGSNPRLLGASRGFIVNHATEQVWLVGDGELRQVDLNGKVTETLAVSGVPVASTAAGFAVQRDDQVLWRVGDRDILIGTGTVLDATFETILWQAADGGLNLTDPNTLSNTRLADIPPDQVPGRIARLSVGALGTAIANEQLLVTGAPERWRPVDLPLADLTWVDDRLIVGLVDGTTSRPAMLIDTVTGAGAQLVDLPAEARFVTVIPARRP